MMDQATELRNYVAKHGKANEQALDSKTRRRSMEWDVTTLGFNMYEVMQMSDDALKLIWDLHERKWH